MKDSQTMKKVVRVTMKKVQAIFVRRKPKNTEDENSMSHTEDDRFRTAQIEDGLEVKVFSPSNSTESSPEPLEMFQSSDEEDDYFTHPREVNRRRRVHGQIRSKSSGPAVVRHKGDQEGACGPLAKVCQNETQGTLVPVNNGRQVVPYDRLPEKSCRSVVLTSCGELEKTCSTLPLELQAKTAEIKQSLLRQYPPFYDFCIIASDDDYDEAIQFKEYVSSSFGLAGCTLDDGFISLGADLFDCYKMMMDQSTKVFFFVTENFTSSAFCKRLQSGAVFLSLMSKAQRDKEKCVPVFPHGFCMAPLALSGIAGLNPTQREVTRRSLDNTYSPLLRQCRLVWDQENFKKRCLEFQIQVTRCIEEAKSERDVASSVQNELSLMSLSENDNSKELEENAPAVEAPPPTPVIQLPENNEFCRQNILNRSHVTEPDSDINFSIEEVKNENQEQLKQKEHSPSQKKSSVENTENGRTRNKRCSVTNDDDGNDDGDSSSVDSDILKNLPIPDEVKTIMNNSPPVTNIKDCGEVHVGHTINIIINPTPSTDFSYLEKHIRTAAFSGKNTSEEHSDSSD